MANSNSILGRWLEGSAEIIFILVCSVLFVPLAIFTSGALRTILSLPFVLFFPGYTLISALFPAKGKLDGMERLALSLGLSLALVPLIGLILNFLPWGITFTPILLAVFGFIFIMSLFTFYRRAKLLPEERFTTSFRAFLTYISEGWARRGRLDRILTVVLSAAILGTIGTIVYAVQSPRASEKFTEFYILGPEGKADNYPRDVILSLSSQVIVGIINHEGETVNYTIGLAIDGQDLEIVGPVSLNPEAKWEQQVSFNATKLGDNQTVQFQLYRGDNVTAYRSLHLFLNVKER